MALLEGIIAATFTPFHDDGTLKLEAIPEYVDYLIEGGVRGLYVCGTTGEGIGLTIEERKKTSEAFLKAADGRVPVVVQVGANSLGDCLELARHAQSAGFTALSANAPSYFQIGDSATLADWMSKIAAEAPDLPFYYYHIPRFTGVSIDMTEYMKLMEKLCPTFRGIKYTDTKAFAYMEAVMFNGGKYEILWGCDEMLLAGLAVGGKGGVGSTYGLAPKFYNKMLNDWNSGDFEQARYRQRLSWEFVKCLLRNVALMPAQKRLLKMIGFDFGPCRLPFPEFPEEKVGIFRADLEKIGYFSQMR